MKLTIIPIDQAVYKDGVVKSFDLTGCGIPQDVHAFQWYESYGEIEFSSNPGQPKPTNEIVQELPQWAMNCVSAWEAWTPPSVADSENQPTVQGAQTL